MTTVSLKCATSQISAVLNMPFAKSGGSRSIEEHSTCCHFEDWTAERCIFTDGTTSGTRVHKLLVLN